MWSSRHPPLYLYVDDHWAAAAGGVALAGQLSQAARKGAYEWGDELQALVVDIADDERVLLSVRAPMGPNRGRLKRSIVRIAEHLTRLAIESFSTRPPELSHVLELEALIAGVNAKRCLWIALRHSNAPARPLSGDDLDDLVHRAEEQEFKLAAIHRRAVSLAFGAPQ